MGDGINDGLGLDEGPSVGTEDSPRLSEGLADELDEGSADGAGMDKGPGVGTDDSAGLAEGPLGTGGTPVRCFGPPHPLIRGQPYPPFSDPAIAAKITEDLQRPKNCFLIIN